MQRRRWPVPWSQMVPSYYLLIRNPSICSLISTSMRLLYCTSTIDYVVLHLSRGHGQKARLEGGESVLSLSPAPPKSQNLLLFFC